MFSLILLFGTSKIHTQFAHILKVPRLLWPGLSCLPFIIVLSAGLSSCQVAHLPVVRMPSSDTAGLETRQTSLRQCQVLDDPAQLTWLLHTSVPWYVKAMIDTATLFDSIRSWEAWSTCRQYVEKCLVNCKGPYSEGYCYSHCLWLPMQLKTPEK